MIIQGAESNHTGGRLERAIELEFKSRGIPVFEYAVKGENGDFFSNRFLLKHVPYTSVYGCSCSSEFVLRDFFGGDIRIECRWQESTGSVDEKYPYFLENAKFYMRRRIYTE